MSEKNGTWFYRLSIPDCNRQRVENANSNARQLKEVNSSKYPSLARILDARGGAKRRRLTQILEYLSNEEERSFYLDTDPERRDYTDIPIKELTGRYGGSALTYASIFNLLTMCGLAIKHNPNTNDEEHYTFIDEEARRHAARQRGRRKLTRTKYYSARVYYHFPQWTEALLSQAEALAEKHTGTLTEVIDAYGADQARSKLDTWRSIPNDTQRAREKIDTYIAEALTERGYTTKAQIMRAVHVLTTKELDRRRRIREGKKVRDNGGRKTVKLKPILDRYLPELCKRYDLTYKQPTKDQIREYNLQDRSWIITRRSAHTKRA